MIALFCGSRNWTNAEAIHKVMSNLDQDGLTIIHGDQRGADRISGEIALELGASVIPVPADWETYGKSAGPIRNEQMKEILIQNRKKYFQPVSCYAFHEDPKLGVGTRDMVLRARKADIRSYVYLNTTPELMRASGEVKCYDCGLPFSKHPSVISELDQDGKPYTELSCSGLLLKL